MGGLALAVREGDVFRRRVLATLRVVHILGGDASRFARRWQLLGLGVTALAGLLGVAVGIGVHALGWLSATFPLTLVPSLGLISGGSLLAVTLVGLLTYPRGDAHWKDVA